MRGDDGTRMQSGLHGAAGGERLWQGLHREHLRHTVNLPGMVESSSSKRGRRATEGVELTGAVDGVGAQLRRRCDLSWSGSSSGGLWSSMTCTRGERWGEAAWHRRSGGK
jgi:hypothetical protein